MAEVAAAPAPEPRKWARTLGEMREELGMPATPLGAMALLTDFDGDAEVTPLIWQLREAQDASLAKLRRPRSSRGRGGPSPYTTPVVGGGDAAASVLQQQCSDLQAQHAGLQKQLRTAERRHPGYFCDHSRPSSKGSGCCSWSGPMWPFETSSSMQPSANMRPPRSPE